MSSHSESFFYDDNKVSPSGISVFPVTTIQSEEELLLRVRWDFGARKQIHTFQYGSFPFGFSFLEEFVLY